MSHLGHPSTGPFPTAEMRQSNDDALTFFKARQNVLIPVVGKSAQHVFARKRRQAKTFGVVTHVTVKRLLRGASQSEP